VARGPSRWRCRWSGFRHRLDLDRQRVSHAAAAAHMWVAPTRTTPGPRREPAGAVASAPPGPSSPVLRRRRLGGGAPTVEQTPGARRAAPAGSWRWRRTGGARTPLRTPTGDPRRATPPCSAPPGTCTCTSPTGCTSAPTSCAWRPASPKSGAGAGPGAGVGARSHARGAARDLEGHRPRQWARQVVPGHGHHPGRGRCRPRDREPRAPGGGRRGGTTDATRIVRSGRHPPRLGVAVAVVVPGDPNVSKARAWPAAGGR